MPNPLFNMINAYQRVNQIMHSMQNPAAFVKQQFPDVPDNILNDPNQVLQYLQQTRNISNEQLQQLMGSH
jgi:hypothetical protein